MRYYFTTSIPYVNADPHIGFALELVQTDCLVRWHRQKGSEVRFLTGTDENALKNVQAAEAAGTPVAEFVAERAERYRELTKVLNASNDDFIRTTEARHVKGAQKLWCAIKPDDLYRKEYSGWYCVGCESFITDKDLVEGMCPIHKTKPELITENNYFFRLSRYQETLLKLIEAGTLEIVPEFRKNEVVQFIRQGLQDLSVSRSVARAHGWGIKVPGDPDQIMYVWVDALSNYMTALGFGEHNSPQPSLNLREGEQNDPPLKVRGGAGGVMFDRWWRDAEVTHAVGKDITRFHAVYWPAFLLSAGLPLPKRILVHGFITSGGQKMSKSLGNVISPFDFIEKYGGDALRYYLLREIPTLDDGDFTREKFVARYNADLANGLGNLVQRVTAMVQKYTDGKSDISSHGQKSPTKGMGRARGEVASRVNHCVQQYQLDRALEAIWAKIAECDKRVDEEKPWALAKDPANQEKLEILLYELITDIKGIGEALTPFLPETAGSILEIVNAERIVPPKAPLFPRK